MKKNILLCAIIFCFFSCNKSNDSDPADFDNTIPAAICSSPDPLDMANAVNWGDGTPASCTQSSLQALITAGNKINCNCGPSAYTLILTATLEVPNKNVSIDGKNLVTISGGNTTRIFNIIGAANQSGGTFFGIQNIKLINGRASKGQRGAAIFGGAFGTMKVLNVTFEANQTPALDPDDCGAVHTILYKEVIFANCIFNNNKGPNGGAVGTIGSAQTFINCRFEGNEAFGTGGTFSQGGSGGAVYVDGVDQNGINNTMSICGCIFINNKSNYQAGALNVVFYAGKGSELSVDKCSFEGNSCNPDKGGAFYFMNGNLLLTNSTFADNSSKSVGGGLWTSNYVARILNCTFKGNTAVSGNDGLAGAIGLDGSGANKTATITNCTFAENRAGNFASGIFNEGNLTLTNNLFANNLVGTGSQSNPYGGAVINKNSNLTVNAGNLQYPKGYSGQFGTVDRDDWMTDIVLFDNPLILPLANNEGPTKTMALPVNSPARDKGTSVNAPSTDQRGKSRNGNIDIGAYEFQ